MGTCYSKSGYEASQSNRDKLPRDKRKRSSKNGHNGSLRKPRFVIEDCDSIQKDVSDTVYTEDSHFIQGTDIDNCINRSQQTSLEKLAKCVGKELDSDGDIEDSGGFEVADQDDTVITDSVTRETDFNDKDVQQDLSERLKQLDANMRDGKVSTSDSGIVMETYRGCDKFEQNCDDGNLEHWQGFEARTDSIDSDHVPSSVESRLTKSVNQSDCTCSKSVKDSRGHVNPTDHSSIGECQGHSFSRSYVNTFSESPLKSSLRKKGSNHRRRMKRLSWKSADSLDYCDSMAICLDRTKSVCSSILGDDISLLNAPLATFDSVDFAIGNSYDFSKRLGNSMEKNVCYSSDTFQFQFDFSGLEGNNRQSVGSIDRISESNKMMESSTDLDKIQLALRQLSVSTPTEHR